MSGDGAGVPGAARDGGGGRGVLSRAFGHPAAPALLCLLAAAARWPLLPFISGDMAGGGGRGWPHWYAFILENGGFAALGHDFGLYNMAWLTLLAGVAELAPSLPAVYAIKAISVPFDFALAYFVYRCVALRWPQSRAAPLSAAAATLLAPAVVLNGAMWGQSDAIYTTFLVASLYFLLKRRPAGAFAAFGLALAFKGPAVFFLPLLLWLAAKREVDWLRHGVWAPVAYLATLLPSWILGRNFYEMLWTYPDQSGQFSDLVKGAANLYQWIPNDLYPYWPVGAAFTVLAVAAVGILVKRSRAALTPDLLVTLAAFSVLVVPFLLPKMHDRYFFPADALTIVLAFYRPRLWPLPVAVALVSAQSHLLFLLGLEIVPLAWCAAVLLAVLVVLGRQLHRDLDLAELFRRRRSYPPGRRRRAGPVFALSAALAGAGLFGLAGARSARPLAGDPASAALLARAANLSREYDFALFTRLAPTEEGEIRARRSPGVALGGPALFGAAMGAAGSDLVAQATAARALALVLLFGAAFLAYRSLRFLGEDRALALGAALLALALTWGIRPDAGVVAGAGDAFGALLVFHGLSGFVREGRFRALLLSAAAALALTFQAYALILPFLILGVLGVFGIFGVRRGSGLSAGRAGEGATGESPAGRSSERVGALSPTGNGPTGNPPAGKSSAGAPVGFGTPFPLTGRRLAALALVGLLSGSALVGLDRVNAAAAGLGDLGPAEALPVGAPASLPADPASLPALLLAAGCLLGAALSRHRLCLLPLAVWGAASLLLPSWLPGGVREGATPFGAWLVLSAAALAGLRRLGGGRGLRAAAGVAAAAVFFAGFRVAHAGRPSGPAPGELREPRDFEARLARDFEEIRAVLRARPETPSVFLPEGALARIRRSGRDAADWYLAGSLVVTGEARRNLAEFVIEDARTASRTAARSGPGRGLLTPDNRELFLYYREAYDGELAGVLDAAGPPAAQADFAVHLHESRLLYVRDGCRPEDLEPQVILHFDPVEKRDLPPHRRQWGFDNRSFHFRNHAYLLGERCVAGAALPDYPIRRVVTGQYHRPESGFEEVWRVEIPLDGAPEADPGGEGGR